MNNLSIKTELWGKTDSGAEVLRYTVNSRHISVSFISLGAVVQKITFDDIGIIFSLPTAELCAKFSSGCMGAIVGRYAGRIAKGHLEIDGITYQLPINDRDYHLHGGIDGFNKKIWYSEPFEKENEAGVIFTLHSPDGDEGYPGALDVTVTYTVNADDTLRIDYKANTDKATAINLTNHCYFNLNGIVSQPNKQPEELGTNRDIELMIDADYITELEGFIPTGKLLDVTNTPFDFRHFKVISDNAPINDDIKGYDHNFCLNNPTLEKPCIIAKSLKSGIELECFTDRPGVQIFSLGDDGSAFALETQAFPDSPNHPNFPSTILHPEEVFTSTTIYKFSKNK